MVTPCAERSSLIVSRQAPENYPNAIIAVEINGAHVRSEIAVAGSGQATVLDYVAGDIRQSQSIHSRAARNDIVEVDVSFCAINL
jgi:hypothetical protein